MKSASQKIPRGWLLGAALLIVFFHVAGLSHFPQINADEGFWASGARNDAKFGHALMDGRLHPFLSPATFLALRCWFAFFPADLLSARVFSVTAGLLSCGLTWLIGRKCFPKRPWLLPLLFGTSSLGIMIHRVILLESHETFWMLLAATLWLLGGGFLSAALAGGALGAALLVKSTSIYLLPVFICSALCPRRANDNFELPRPNVSARLLLAMATCLLVAGAGYLADWAVNPSAFATAFRFELVGKQFGENAWFHVGRFGFDPSLISAKGGAAIILEPVLIPLSILAAVIILRRFRSASLADRFFALWLVLGTGFTLGQIYVELHYLATIVPAFAYLSARLFDGMLDAGAAPAPRWRRPIATAAICLACVLGIGHVGYGILTHSEADYWPTTEWIAKNLPPDSNVLAAPYVNLSLPQRGYDFYRLTHPYDATVTPPTLREIVDRYDISTIVVDPEWRESEGSATDEFLVRQCRDLKKIGRFEIYAVRRDTLTRPYAAARWSD